MPHPYNPIVLNEKLYESSKKLWWKALFFCGQAVLAAISGWLCYVILLLSVDDSGDIAWLLIIPFIISFVTFGAIVVFWWLWLIEAAWRLGKLAYGRSRSLAREYRWYLVTASFVGGLVIVFTNTEDLATSMLVAWYCVGDAMVLLPVVYVFYKLITAGGPDLLLEDD